MLRRNSSQLLLACLYLLSVLALSMLFLHKTLQQQRELHNENPMAPMKGGGEGHLSAAGGERFSIYGMPARRQYPRRVGMGECPPLFGRIVVFMVVEQHMMPLSKNYGVAQKSLDCYIRSTNYTLRRLDLDEDERATRHCSKYQNLFFRKHCMVAHYLNETDWALVLDADTGVVNPNHCIEEWIDDRVDIVFYERFFNWEIMSGNYLVKNTPFARKFLLDWAEMEFWQPLFSSSDNGALQLHILKTVLPGATVEINACERYWNRSADYDTLMAYTTCVRNALGAQRIWPPKLRILRRAHGFARDWHMTDDYFSELDFMFHGWKPHDISGDWKSPFEQIPNPNECGGGNYGGWHWRRGKRVAAGTIQLMLAEQERHVAEEFPLRARINAHLSEPDIGPCYPSCDEGIE